MNKPFTRAASDVLEAAVLAAEATGQSYVGTEHILQGLTDADGSTSQSILAGNGITAEAVRKMLSRPFLMTASVVETVSSSFSPRTQELLENAGVEAQRVHAKAVGTEHLLLALLKMPDAAASRIISGLGGNIQKIMAETYTAMGEDFREHRSELGLEKTQGGQKSQPGILPQFSRDLSALAAAGKLDPVIGRDQEIERIVQILSRRTKNNPCLTGEPGVGKTSIVEGLAQRIVQGQIQGPIRDKRILSLDLPAMVAGSKYRGEFEERVKKVIREVMDDGHIILFMDEIHTMIGAGGAEGSIDAANILKPALARGEIQIIGATTLEEFRKYFEKDAALERRFQPVYVEQPGREESVRILEGLRPDYEAHHGVVITDAALASCVDLSMRYINDRFLPDKAIDLMDEAASLVKLSSWLLPPAIQRREAELKSRQAELENALKAGDMKAVSEISGDIRSLKTSLGQSRQKNTEKTESIVTEEHVAKVVSKWTRIPVSSLAQEESEKLKHLEEKLHERVVAQDEAVTSLSRAIRRGRAGLKDPKKPIGSFLFLGPTGVGKTELSKALAQALFGTENAIIRVDMSEYMEKHSVSKLIGSPPGYVGYDEGGQLSEQVRRNPYSVILFDEIEKAHPDVFNILLQVLDDGRITDSHGRVTDFCNTIIIMTSNAGASRIMEPKNLGFASKKDDEADYRRMKDAVMNEVRHLFRPEFINRIDEIIVFAALTKDDMGQIADIILREIAERAEKQMNIRLRITENARAYLVEKGYDRKYGARSLKRTIQSLLENTLSEQILDGRVQKDSTVTVDVKDEKLVFRSRQRRTKTLTDTV